MSIEEALDLINTELDKRILALFVNYQESDARELYSLKLLLNDELRDACSDSV